MACFMYIFLMKESNSETIAKKMLVKEEIKRTSSKKVQSRQPLDIFSEKVPIDQ